MDNLPTLFHKGLLPDNPVEEDDLTAFDDDDLQMAPLVPLSSSFSSTSFSTASFYPVTRSRTRAAANHGKEIPDKHSDPAQLTTMDEQSPMTWDEAAVFQSFQKAKYAKKSDSENFPIKLHKLLDKAAELDIDHILSWNASGLTFKIHDKKLLVSMLNSQGWKQTKWDSFQRQLNHYGFRRLSHGPEKGSYQHDMFIKGQKALATFIRSNRKSMSKKNKDSDELPTAQRSVSTGSSNCSTGSNSGSSTANSSVATAVTSNKTHSRTTTAKASKTTTKTTASDPKKDAAAGLFAMPWTSGIGNVPVSGGMLPYGLYLACTGVPRIFNPPGHLSTLNNGSVIEGHFSGKRMSLVGAVAAAMDPAAASAHATSTVDHGKAFKGMPPARRRSSVIRPYKGEDGPPKTIVTPIRETVETITAALDEESAFGVAKLPPIVLSDFLDKANKDAKITQERGLGLLFGLPSSAFDLDEDAYVAKEMMMSRDDETLRDEQLGAAGRGTDADDGDSIMSFQSELKIYGTASELTADAFFWENKSSGMSVWDVSSKGDDAAVVHTEGDCLDLDLDHDHDSQDYLKAHPGYDSSFSLLTLEHDAADANDAIL